MRSGKKIFLSGIYLVIAGSFLASCSPGIMGWGVLLWSNDNPPIPSGTVLPVYIRSNVDKVWVVGVPEELRHYTGGADKTEIPLTRLEMQGSRRRAVRWANSFARYALLYAENTQDGLPIRDSPDNNGRRVYRMRMGEIVKVLSLAEQGIPAIGASGEPLSGSWYRVLTEDGTIGYCFSFRLKLFDYSGGQLDDSLPDVIAAPNDPDLDMLLTRTWSPQSYSAMISSRSLNIEELSRFWRFEPGQGSGMARIFIKDIDRSFSHTGIHSNGARSWFFEGTGLSMQLRNNTTLAVQYPDEQGDVQTLIFVSLPVEVQDLITQETGRRERLYTAILMQGPDYTSSNYGTISLKNRGAFTWTGFDLLVPDYIPYDIEGDGFITMDIFLAPSLETRYTGAFTMRFNNPGDQWTEVKLYCIYFLDDQGLRMEIVPESNIEDTIVMSRDASPMALYFFIDDEEQ
ncbi:MAG: SH3 domain-containing protein [Treponema sp.]|nr:SH3 domain-containing protein [Treponema sp.]